MKLRQAAALAFFGGAIALIAISSLSMAGSEGSDALIVCPGATDVRFAAIRGSEQVTYKVAENFPAPAAIKFVFQGLERQQWKALTHDFLNPDLPSGAAQGWTYFIDDTKSPPECIHQWLGDWKQPSGSIVRYGFRYRSESTGDCGSTTSALTNLEVSAIYLPAAVAHENLEALKRFEEKQKLQRAPTHEHDEK